MTDVTVRYSVAFRKREGSAMVRTSPAAAQAATPTPPAEPSPTARLLALAYWIERQVRAGALKDYRRTPRASASRTRE